MIKRFIVIADGMSGWPLPSTGQTTLEMANSPNLDYMAAHGHIGLAKNTPDQMVPGSDVANLSIFGYDPTMFYQGRAPIEAIAQGIQAEVDDVFYRANLVMVENETMKDFTAGHVTNEVGARCMEALNQAAAKKYPELNFYPGVSYRNLLKWKRGPVEARTTPPHDITGQLIKRYLPLGDRSEKTQEIMAWSREVLAKVEMDRDRAHPTQIWLWGQGRPMVLPSFKERTGLDAAVITAVDLIKGLGVGAGLKYISVPGITGFVDTNFQGKADYAIQALETVDLVFIHIEAADESGHMGDFDLKIKSIESIDKEVLGRIRSKMKGHYQLLVLPDHATPIEIKTHAPDPVPYVFFDSALEKTIFNDRSFSEKSARAANPSPIEGFQLMAHIFALK